MGWFFTNRLSIFEALFIFLAVRFTSGTWIGFFEFVGLMVVLAFLNIAAKEYYKA